MQAMERLFRVASSELPFLPYDLILAWATLYREVFGKPPWNDDLDVPRLVHGINRDLERPRAEAFIALAGHGTGEEEFLGGVLGYAVSRRDLDEISNHTPLGFLFENGSEGGEVFFVDTLCVDENHRRKGIGEELLRSLIEAARAKYGLKSVILRTHPEATEAVRLFRRVEFQELGINDRQHADRTWWRLAIQEG